MIVGVDLGTTNSALAFVDDNAERPKITDHPVTQLVAIGDATPMPTLPSFMYLAGPHELPANGTKLPWGAPESIVGELARIQGREVPARLVSSAKSWLCHPNVDRLAAILPWGSQDVAELKRVSPVEAQAKYLAHLAADYQHTTKRSLADEEIVLCVPASFDEVARELTLRAASDVGLRPTLLEEPQAAFYAYLAEHGEADLSAGDQILVFDVGGGTTDFSLISVEGPSKFARTAVGDHLLLGGDNMDLALARRVEQRLGKLDAHQFQALVAACRLGKEKLLSDGDRANWTVTVAGRSSRLIGGTMRDELSRAEVVELIVDGFFPRVPVDSKPEKRGAIREFGLPYAADAAITKHLAHFLARHNARPTAVLWNGGVLHSSAIRDRVLEVLASWGPAPRVLPTSSPDLAVARGAAYYGLARRGKGLRVGGGAARAYYVGLDTTQITPGQVTALALVPRGMLEGQEITLDKHPLEVLTNRPVRFRLFASSERHDQAGDVITVPVDELVELPALYTVLRFARSSQNLALSVALRARLSELGTIELEVVARGTGHEGDRWKLDLDLRAAEQPSAEPPPPPPEVDTAALASAKEILQKLYSASTDGSQPASVMKLLSQSLGPKDTWSTATLRALFEILKDLRGGRGKSGPHEARWLNLVGFSLRPGFGYPLDDWRVKEAWRMFNAGLVHDKDEPCRLEWWILWRRVSGGLTRTQQDEIYKRIAPHFLPSFAKQKDRKAPSTAEAAEMWRALASMERLPHKQKSELADVLMTALEKKSAGREAPWALGRLGARVPLYGPVEDALPPKRAEKFCERLLALEWTNELALCAAELARCSGDRARDLDENLRRRLAERLKSMTDGARLARLVLEPVPREEREERLAFGESLPSGLRWVAGVENV
jgi:molecular chaperone DnaK (HSP70)